MHSSDAYALLRDGTLQYTIPEADKVPHESQLLKGILEGCTLALLDTEGTYGYAVVERLREAGFDDIREATVYPILKRLEQKGLLAFKRQPSELGPPRKVYALTESGRRELFSFTESWQKIRSVVDTLLARDQL
jgi:PadR family transcriptional regulator PadR